MLRRFSRLLPSSRYRIFNKNNQIQSLFASNIPSTDGDDDVNQMKENKPRSETQDIIDAENEQYRQYKASQKRSQSREKKYPQQILADTFVLSTDDKIEFVSENIRRAASSKGIGILCTLGAMVSGKTGWYQFDFIGMPSEMEFVMVHLPLTFVAIHWISWYINMNGIYNKLVFKLPKGWKPNTGLIFGSNPRYHQLVDISCKNNLDLIDNLSYQMNKHRTMAAILCATNITIIMLTATINPFTDPALASLDVSQVIGYSIYPVFAWSLTAVIHGSPLKNIGGWKKDIVQELNIDQENMTDVDVNDTKEDKEPLNV